MLENLVGTEKCVGAAVLALGSVFVAASQSTSKTTADFVAVLDTRQRERYTDIVNARRRVYTIGLSLGLALGAALVWTKTRIGQQLVSAQSLYQLIIVTQLVCYFYYILAPKPQLMVVTLASERLRERWAEAYRSAQLRQSLAFVLAAASVTLACVARGTYLQRW